MVVPSYGILIHEHFSKQDTSSTSKDHLVIRFGNPKDCQCPIINMLKHPSFLVMIVVRVCFSLHKHSFRAFLRFPTRAGPGRG